MTRLAPRPFAAAFGALLALAVPVALSAAGITGRVTDESEAPIAGARVTLHPVDTGAALGTRWLEGESFPGVVADTLTGDDGSFRLDTPDGSRLFWTVVVRARGRVPMQQEVGPLFGPVHLESAGLAEDVGAVVRVLEKDGAPAAGATVLFAAAPGTPLLGGRRGGWFPGAFRAARTGPDGRARLPRAAGESGAVAVVSSGRLARATLASTRLRVTLPPAGGPGSRTLRAIGPEGEPVAGALVWGPAELVPPRARVTARMGRFPLTVTAEDGTAVVPAAALAAQQPVTLYLEASSGLRAQVEIEPPAPPADPEPGAEAAPNTAPAVPVRLTPPAVLAGRVEESGGGGPVADAVVWARGGAADAVRSDGAGRFALPVPPVERIMLVAAGPAHQAPAWERLELESPDRAEHVLVLEPTISLVGRVEDEAGRPVAGAVVEAQPREELSFGRGRNAERRRVVSDENGRFRTGGIAFETLYGVVATLDGFAPGRADVPPVPRNERGAAAPPEVTIVLPLGQRLVGRVVDAAGAPVAGAEVRYLHVGDEVGWLPHRYAEMKATSGPEGDLSLSHVMAGVGKVFVDAPGFAPFERSGIEVPAEPGVTDLGALELEPEVFLEVVVVDDDGDPVAGAAIGITRRSSGPFGFGMSQTHGPAESRTDEAGRFREGGFGPGQVVGVTASKEGFAPASADRIHLPDGSPVRVVLEPGAIVSGRVVDEAGRPVPEAFVRPDLGDPTRHTFAMLSEITDADGRFVLDDLPARPVRLTARTDEGSESAAVLLELAPGERYEGVELTVRTEPAFRVRVFRPNGEPAARASVYATSPDGSGSSCSPVAAGELECRGMRPGTYRMTAIEEGVGRIDREVDAGRVAPAIDLHLEPEIEVAGRVLGADGEPAAARMVMLRALTPAFPPIHEATTTTDGSFVFRGVENGTFQLTVSFARGSRWLGTGSYEHPEEIVVSGGASVRGIVVRLEQRGGVAGRLLGLEEGEAGSIAVKATGPAEADFQRPVPGRVLADGRYEIAGLAPGTWRVDARSAESGTRGEGEVVVTPGAGDAILDLDLRRGLVLSGTVRAGGEPWSGVSISIPTALVYGEADAQGRFRLAGLEPGTYELILHDRTGARAIRREARLEEDREIVIEVELGRVRGTVLSAVGMEPIAGARVMLLRGNGEERRHGGTTTTAVDGRFLLDRVPADAYVVEVEAPGHRSTAAELRVGEGDTTIPPIVLQPEVE